MTRALAATAPGVEDRGAGAATLPPQRALLPLLSVHRVLWFAVAALITTPAAAVACSCAGSCGSILSAPAVFEATVVAIDRPAGGLVVVRLSDVRTVRGAASPRTVTTSADFAACGYRFAVGERYLIDAHEYQPGHFSVSSCSKTMRRAEAGGMLALVAAAPDTRARVFGRIATRTAAGEGRADGPAVSGAVVRLTGPVERSTTTNANGEYSFTAVPDGDYEVAATTPVARRDVAAPSPARIALGGSDVCATVDLVAVSTAQMSGAVVDSAGAPVAGVRVELFPWPYDQWAGGIVTAATTDSSGRYTIENIAPGLYAGGLGVPYPSATNAVAPALVRSQRGDVIVSIEPGAALVMPALVATAAPIVTVGGRVSVPSGVSVEGIELVLHPLDGFATAREYGGTTGRDGRFAIRAHRGVRYRVVAASSAGVAGQAEFVAGDGEIEIVLRAPR